jgi:hypothetical protein
MRRECARKSVVHEILAVVLGRFVLHPENELVLVPNDENRIDILVGNG